MTKFISPKQRGVPVHLPHELNERIKAQALREGRTKEEAVETAVRAYLQSRGHLDSEAIGTWTRYAAELLALRAATPPTQEPA